ncbi:hypothetical protein FG386_001893 [Cryptosporidium ryanae]|uniref:uncharacterized protein n=1 Tax=Cryptosporidium ryanae TaxID=515981 RepID=UPI00351A65EF|nr:hypothetical protein FG386_001893 [Cryptosporidium ryanae]
MSNSIYMEFLLYKRVDICFITNTKAADKNICAELLNNLLKDSNFIDKIHVLESKRRSFNGFDYRLNEKIVFARLEIDDFKILFTNYIENNENIILNVVRNGAENEINVSDLIKNYICIDIGPLNDRLTINNSELNSNSIINSIVNLINNYNKNDYLESFIMDNECEKTLSYFDCLDNHNIYKKELSENDKIQINNVIFINIEKESTKYYHINSIKDNEIELMGKLEIGEYTFLGLYKTINFNMNLNLSDIENSIQEGNIETCDQLVKDIYGQSYNEANLDEDIVASSLGKLQFINRELKSSIPSKDILKSITILLSTSIIQKGLIHSQIKNKKSIIIYGFIANFPKIMASIYNTFKLLSNNQINVYFLKSEINLSLVEI